MAYGPTEIEKLDIYRAKESNAPIFVYIHGGAWLSGEAKNNAFAAEMFVNAGAHFLSLDFIAIKDAGGDLRVMAEQVRRAIAWTYKNAASFGGDSNRLYIGGFSSGGHLCGIALVTDWQKDFGLPVDAVKGGLCMSGMYDIKRFTGGYSDDNVYFNNPMDFVQHEGDWGRLEALRRMDIILATGKDDSLRHESERMSSVLWNKGIGNALRLWDGWSHDWPYWKKMLHTYMGGHD